MRVLCLLAAGLSWAATVHGAEVETQQPAGTNDTVITSDQLDYDYPRAIAVFTGNVVVTDKEIKMWADQMTVILSTTDEVESITAVGNVRIAQGARRAHCRKAIFLVSQNEVILTGNAVIFSGSDEVHGKVITIWTDTNHMVCEPGRLILRTRDGA
ncbi:MAG: hypothetical protein HQ523_10945 [Lentisphaerae bacterium]|nr:hypothetical protein [Lentisphaerota bacterium]